MNFIQPETATETNGRDIDIIESARSAIKDVINASSPETLIEIGKYARKAVAEIVCVKGLVDRASGTLVAIARAREDEADTRFSGNTVPAEFDVGVEEGSFAIRNVRCEGLGHTAHSSLLDLAGEINIREDSL